MEQTFFDNLTTKEFHASIEILSSKYDTDISQEDLVKKKAGGSKKKNREATLTQVFLENIDLNETDTSGLPYIGVNIEKEKINFS